MPISVFFSRNTKWYNQLRVIIHLIKKMLTVSLIKAADECLISNSMHSNTIDIIMLVFLCRVKKAYVNFT